MQKLLIKYSGVLYRGETGNEMMYARSMRKRKADAFVKTYNVTPFGTVS